MPSLALSAKNAMLNALSIQSISLHTAYSATGDNEVIGGSPAYARLPATFASAGNGLRTMSGVLAFDVPAITVAWVGLWGASSTFVGMLPNNGNRPRPCALDDLVADTFKCANHGFVANDSLVIWGGSAGLLPTGVAEGTIYYAVNVTTTTLQLAASSGGAAIALTTAGNGFLQRITPVVYAAQGQHPVAGISLDATIAA